METKQRYAVKEKREIHFAEITQSILMGNMIE